MFTSSSERGFFVVIFAEGEEKEDEVEEEEGEGEELDWPLLFRCRCCFRLMQYCFVIYAYEMIMMVKR